VKEDGEEGEMRLLEYKSKLFLSGDCLPDPFTLKSGWIGEKDGKNRWPSIYITDISTYIEGCSPRELVTRLMGEYKLGKA